MPGQPNTSVHFKQVAIISVGLIGGSLGMILKRDGLADAVVGVGRRIENLKTAVELGAIDRYVSDARDGVRDADLVVLATPVDTYERHVKEWGASLKPGAIVSDVGSVKGALVERAARKSQRETSITRSSRFWSRTSSPRNSTTRWPSRRRSTTS